MKYAMLAAIPVVAALVILVVLKRRSTTIPQGVSPGVDPRSPIASSRPENVWFGLRNMVLTLKPEDQGVEPGSTDTYGFVMEIGHANKDAKVTVVALRDGTMSLYLSTGGGTLGTGQRFSQAGQLAKDVVAAVREFVGKMDKTTTYPVPATGRVRFFVLTGQGVYTAETNEADLTKRQDPLFPLYAGGQNILTQIRIASQGAQRPQAR